MQDWPDDLNGDVLRRMAASGDPLTAPRDIDFSVMFETRKSAETFIGAWGVSGYRLALKPYGDEWDVTITRVMVPDHELISQFEIDLERAVKPLGGRNDGWGCFQKPSN